MLSARYLIGVSPSKETLVRDAIIYNLIGLLGPDICTVTLFTWLLVVSKKRLYWSVQITGAIIVRLMRIFISPQAGTIYLPILIVMLIVACDGPFFRKLLVVGIGLTCMTAPELPLSVLWLSLTGEQLSGEAVAMSHLPVFIVCQIVYCMSLLLLALILRPFTRRFIGQQGFLRTSASVAAFPFLQGVILFCCMYCVAFSSSSWSMPTLVLGMIAGALATASSALLILDVQASIDKAASDLEAEETMALADSYMERYAALEQSIERCAMLRHDIRNQLGVIAELAAKGEMEQAQALTEALRTAGERASFESTSSDSGELDVSSHIGDSGSAASASPSLVTRRSYRLARAFYLVSFSLTAAVSIITLLVSDPSVITRIVEVVALVAGVLLIPVVFRTLHEAHDADMATEQARSAELVLAASREYGERLEGDVREAERIRLGQLAKIDEVAGLIQTGDVDALELRVAASHTESVASRRWCEHSAVNMLLEMKAQRAEDAGVRFDSDVVLPRDIALPALDLCAAFSNMLDNAIDAAQAAPADSRWVRIAAGQQGGYLVMRVENGLAEGASKKRGSDAPGIEEHGWGLRILAELARRHDGELTTSSENGVFVTQMALRAPEGDGAKG